MSMSSCTQNALVVKELSKRYPDMLDLALNDLNLTVGRGEIFGLLGPNGAGKTTAVSIMSTILPPTSGSVFISGIDSTREPVKARRQIGLVPQDIALYPELTAWENLSFFGRLHGLRGAKLKTAIQDSLCAVGLEEKAYQKVATYSGGMKRRINLAIGLVHRPMVLFLDEPTVGIDAQSRQLITEKLYDIRKTGTSIIYTTHHMEEAEQICDRVAIMDKGRMLCQGTPEQMIKRHRTCKNLNELFLHLTGKSLRD